MNSRRAFEIHEAAASAFVEAADAVPPDRWHEPIADGKWTPAQIADHLILTYETLLAELRGAPGMKVKTRWWQRLLLRATMVPRILAGRGFPKAARAPREVRPGERRLEQEAALELFRSLSRDTEEAARTAKREQRLTHAYFGRSSVAKGVLLCARHIEHHTAQIAVFRESRLSP